VDARGAFKDMAEGCSWRMKVVVDFWEDHCTECGEPTCFASCGKFLRGAHGRCNRVEFLDGGRVRFHEWGKLELLWHGKMASPETAARLKAWNARWERFALFLQRTLGWLPLPYGRGPYGIFRSIRWRRAMRMAEFGGSPEKWRFSASSKIPVALLLEVRSANGDVVFAHRVDVDSGLYETCLALPRIEPGALFSVRPVDPQAEIEVAIAVNELFAGDAAQVKCVAWDLDGVLWKGVLSEGDDVALDENVMNVIKALDARGIVSSICSKNDETETIAKLKSLGVEEWFVFPQINWGPKSESLKRLADEMNIGLDSIAFIDDREENRKEVSERLPQVRVFSEAEVSSLVPRIASAGNAVAPSGALGSSRRRMYREEMKRRMAFKSFGSDAEAFAAASGLEFEMMSVEGDRMVRCRELVQRTNQLNLTARRYDEKAFGELVASTECRAVRVYDKYGDYGIVGFVAWHGTHLVECCFSCRVARRGVERKVLDAVAGGRRFTADVVATERNQPIRDIVKEWLAGGC